MSANLTQETTTVEINWDTWEIHKQGCSGNARSHRVNGSGFRDYKEATDTVTGIVFRDDIETEIRSAGDYLDFEEDPRAVMNSFICRCLSHIPWKNEASH